MRIVYVAEDGREFDNQYKCELYEQRQKVIKRNLRSRFFNHDGKPMNINDLGKCVEEGWYMEIATIEEALFIAEYAEEYYGLVLFEGMPQVGRFYFDEESEEWRSIESLYTPYVELLKIFEGED